MVLGIFVFVFEIVLITIGNMPLLDAGWSWFVIIGMGVATLLAIIGIFVNAFGIKEARFYQEGIAKNVVGLVFSIVSTVLGAIFLVAFFAVLSVLL